MTQTDAIVRHPFLGPALPSRNWVPAPRYILRRDRVLRHLSNQTPCRVLDIGCGPATLLSELSERGFEAFGVDRSAQALDLAQALVSNGARMTLRPELDEGWKGSFDILMSFEVIEHLEDDIGAMCDWRDYLRPGGKMILSTPAHPSRWNAADVWAGHVRRYERDGLIRALKAAGFELELIECYGFPLANAMEVLRARAYGKQLENDSKSSKTARALTGESGSDRTVETRYWRYFAGPLPTLAMRAFCQLQRPFLSSDLGNGYLVVAKAV